MEKQNGKSWWLSAQDCLAVLRDTLRQSMLHNVPTITLLLQITTVNTLKQFSVEPVETCINITKNYYLPKVSNYFCRGVNNLLLLLFIYIMQQSWLLSGNFRRVLFSWQYMLLFSSNISDYEIVTFESGK